MKRFFHWNQMRGGAEAVDGAGERDRHLGVRADAEALADHQPRAEPAPAEEVVAAAGARGSRRSARCAVMTTR